MALANGTRIGPYEITDALGAGGMGEVYRARDTRLKRDVALKLLPESFASDRDRLARFQREAEVLASLNHPNIAHVYGLEQSDGVQALVMELVEGPTLADRISQGPIPLDEALPIAKQIAEALEAAHEQGIIHRDLKPANIKLRADGTVKVLDFGLAKALEPMGAMSPSVSQSPTITTPAATMQGVILGTAAYMSPEQAKGRPADKRSDVWGFGCVVYEMLTGRRAFDAVDVSETLAAVLMKEPDWTALPVGTPPAIRRLLERCLDRDRSRRLQHAGDASIRIGEATFEQHSTTVTAASSVPLSRQRLWILLAAASTIGVFALAIPAISHLRERPAPEPAEIRTEIVVPGTTDPTSFALSPDGQRIVFAATDKGVQRLWVRTLASTTAQPLEGSEGGAYPFWSPDSRAIGFFAEGRLKGLDLGTGRPQTLTSVAGGRGGAWNSDGIIIFQHASVSALVRISAGGGQAAPLTKLDHGQQAHRYPQFLPDGRHFLFFASGGLETQGIYLGSLDTAETTRLAASDTAAAFLSPGWLLWVKDGALLAQRLDLARRALSGDVVQLAAPVASEALGGAAVSTSTTGMVAFRAGLQSRRQLRWVDRSGRTLGTLGRPDENGLNSPRLSPGERQVSVHRTVQGNSDIWLLDGDRVTRFTFDPAVDRFAEWSPDGKQISFDSNRTARRELFIKLVDGTRSEQPLFKAGSKPIESETPSYVLGSVGLDWSADGRFLLYADVKAFDFDLWMLPLAEEREPFPFLTTEFIEKGAQFSPDGRWVAYMSNESGRMDIYVRPFIEQSGDGLRTGLQGQRTVSTDGGIYPTWRADGKELYYLAPDGTMMAVPISITIASVEVGTPSPLFQTQIYGGGTDNLQNRQYDVARDGRFLINTLLDDTTPITLLQNWNPAAPK